MYIASTRFKLNIEKIKSIKKKHKFEIDLLGLQPSYSNKIAFKNDYSLKK